ncbi:MAG: malto-oligosyltrehalose synthase [Sporichthyaceae bacterium]
MLTPSATYRLQLHAEFGFWHAAEIVDYLANLGVSHLYLSPVLAAVPGSTHGYDVVDHDELAPDLGGADGFHALAARAKAAGLGVVVDVVPNHMALPTPAWRNAQLWSVLRDGPHSHYANWFDVDWTTPQRAMLMPLLGRRINECLDDGEIVVDHAGCADAPDDGPVLRYFDHVLPIRPGTEDLPLEELLDRQWYRLAYWRVGDEELNYRRFFDVETLAAIRVEKPEVFAGSHYLLGALVREGIVDGLRIDHPDGLADPAGYLRNLQEMTDGRWVVVEKILEGEESLPADWACHGTTGYDALFRIGGLFLEQSGFEELREVYHRFVGGPRIEFAAVVETAKRHVVRSSLHAEVARLTALAADICAENVRLRDHTRRGLEEALVELLVAFDVYRAYVVPGTPADSRAVATVTGAAERAKRALPEERHDTVDLVVDLALGRLGRAERARRARDEREARAIDDIARRDEFCVRFQQTTGPAMAKGIEDTAGYRWFPLASVNEVGGHPAHPAVAPDRFHAWAEAVQRDWPATMTTLSTHDTKRGEDVRARLAVLAELPETWSDEVAEWDRLAMRHRGAAGEGRSRPDTAGPDPVTEYLLWQTLLGAWPIDADRLVAYLEKATREAKVHTTWTSQNAAYESALAHFARAVLADARIVEAVEEFSARLAPHARVVSLSQKLLQLTMSGVPDVYQGAEFAALTLVDPDNRRPVDYDVRRAALAALDAGEAPKDLDAEKLLVTSRALRLRRERPECFAGAYRPLATGSEHLVGFVRGEGVAALATRLPVALAEAGGWGAETVDLPPGTWTDLLTHQAFAGSPRIAEVLAALPVALLAESST